MQPDRLTIKSQEALQEAQRIAQGFSHQQMDGEHLMLALIGQERVDLIAPIPQVLSEGFRPLGIVAAIAPVTIMALLCIRIAQSSVMFAGNTRLPMVAGWDRLLPDWFTRLHAKHKTPVNSIIFVGAATLALGLVGLIGVGKQEAFQLLWNASGVFYALTYLVMFAIPLVGLRGLSAKPPNWLKLTALSGFLMTLLYVALSIVPIIQVESRLTFGVKIGALIVLTNIISVMIFVVIGRRRRAKQEQAVNVAAD